MQLNFLLTIWSTHPPTPGAESSRGGRERPKMQGARGEPEGQRGGGGDGRSCWRRRQGQQQQRREVSNFPPFLKGQSRKFPLLSVPARISPPSASCLARPPRKSSIRWGPSRSRRRKVSRMRTKCFPTSYCKTTSSFNSKKDEDGNGSRKLIAWNLQVWREPWHSMELQYCNSMEMWRW